MSVARRATLGGLLLLLGGCASVDPVPGLRPRTGTKSRPPPGRRRSISLEKRSGLVNKWPSSWRAA